jgi:hypothetical protein
LFDAKLVNDICNYIKNNPITTAIAIITGIIIFILGRILWAFLVYINKIIKETTFDKNKFKKMKSEMISFASHQLARQINSKKYIPDIYIEISELKEQLRFFCYPLLFCNKLIDEINNLNFSSINEYLILANPLT